jgi:hypothetical protein
MLNALLEVLAAYSSSLLALCGCCNGGLLLLKRQ